MGEEQSLLDLSPNLTATNLTVNTTSEELCATQLLLDSTTVRLIFVLLYAIIFCLGFFGNILGKNQKKL